MTEATLTEGRIEPREVITALYRSFLKRDPDTSGLETHVGNLRRNGLQSVVDDFLTSSEFLERMAEPESAAPRGPDLSRREPPDIQIHLSGQQKAKLWAHIGRVWSGLGDTDPYWSVLADSKYKTSDRDVIEEFYATGGYDAGYLDGFLERNSVRLPEQAVIAEFGCGVGRVTRWLARKYARVLAFDVSAPHLRAARERMTAEGLSNVEFVHVVGLKDLARLKDFDLFFSFIVLQHNPPPIMADILGQACRGLNPGGVAFFQAPTYGKGYSFNIDAYLDEEYKRSDMEMHFLPQQEIFRILGANDLDMIEVRQDHCIGNFDRWISNTFLAKKRGR